MAKIEVYFMGNGNTAAFNEKGEQVPVLQEPWVMLYAKHLIEQGIKLEDVRLQLPSGHKAVYEEGTWRVV